MYEPYNILYRVANGYTFYRLKQKAGHVGHRLFSKDTLYTSMETTVTVDQYILPLTSVG